MKRTCEKAISAALSLCLAGALSPSVSFAFAQTDDSDQPCSGLSTLEKVDDSAAEVLQEYFDSREDEICGDSTLASNDDVEVTETVQQASNERADGFEAMEDAANIVVTDADSSLNVTDVDQTNDGLDVCVYEETTFTYDDLADGKGGSDTASFGTWHSVTLEGEADDWLVSSDEFDETDLCGVDTTQSSVSACSLQAKATVKPTLYEAYDPANAIAYSDKYWSSYNSTYRNFNSVGGDCANFVSQCIYAGGMPQIYGNTTQAWFYKSSSSYTSSWTYCPSFVASFKYRGTYIKNPKASQIYPGSPVVYTNSKTWSHATICVGYNSAGTPVINAHNSNRYHVPYTYWDVTKCTIQLTTSATSNLTFTTGSDGIYVDSNLLNGSETGMEQVFEWVRTGSSSVALVAYLGTDESVIVPSQVTMVNADGTTKPYTVKSIRAKAFKGNTTITKVTIPDSVTKIGSQAFRGCASLATLKGAQGLTSIGSTAFMDCSSLKKMPKLAKLKTIYNYGFYRCASLKRVPTMPLVKTLGKFAFAGCSSIATANLTSLKLTSLGASVFKDCTSLKKINLASKVLKTVGASALSGCSKLLWIKIHSLKLGYAKVAKGAFEASRAKVKVYVPKKKYTKYLYLLYAKGLSLKAKVKKL